MNARFPPRNELTGALPMAARPSCVYEPKNGMQKSGGPTQSPGPSGCAAAQADNMTPAAIATSARRAERASNESSFMDGEPFGGQAAPLAARAGHRARPHGRPHQCE